MLQSPASEKYTQGMRLMSEKTMRAAVFTEHGDLDKLTVVDDLPVPEPGPGEVRVAMKAAALNRLDLFVRVGWKGLDLAMPHVVGSDGAGVVDALGAGVSGYAPGDRVAIDPGVIPVDGLQDPRAAFNNQTRNIAIFGEHRPGLAAEYAIVPARNLVKMPDDFPFTEAASAGLVFLTAWHSLMVRGGLKAGESVLIVGAGGGVNSASIQIAKLAGATVYVVGSTAEKCAGARELGADFTINRAEEPAWSKAVYKLTEKRGVDVVVDNVGEATLGDSVRCVRVGGRVLVVGGTSGPKAEIDVRQIFARQVSIIGSTMGEHRDYVTVMNLIFAGKLKPVVGKVFALDEVRAAQATLANFDVFGKVVLRVTE